MTIQHATVDAQGHGVEWRVNPKSGLTVERRLPSGRWEVISRHATRDDARARLFELAGRPKGK